MPPTNEQSLPRDGAECSVEIERNSRGVTTGTKIAVRWINQYDPTAASDGDIDARYDDDDADFTVPVSPTYRITLRAFLAGLDREVQRVLADADAARQAAKTEEGGAA